MTLPASITLRCLAILTDCCPMPVMLRGDRSYPFDDTEWRRMNGEQRSAHQSTRHARQNPPKLHQSFFVVNLDNFSPRRRFERRPIISFDITKQAQCETQLRALSQIDEKCSS
uniref:Uncharacterized protein n=1 Tax=Compsopogon caeruleus TaxID=31354 RepID=A0A7S1T7N8_9RHOD|mmetsp:Transcript_12401/g.25262  ORF Transcript_12401/g.25262 Transcript_12401/m.25262 type:complete len:113 (+) Transcript_12401:149-487(+)